MPQTGAKPEQRDAMVDYVTKTFASMPAAAAW
jgi:hypothetical protein